ncbi:MAG TPA: lipocalin family protein [Sphingomicrobium sp.]|nr:lipocalin family protein [Sphingomicrobium sp.]
MRNSNKALISAGVVTVALAAFTASWLRARHPVGNPHVPEPVKAVDLQRYLGRWYETARYDQRFERGCVAATADYALRPDGKIDVMNRCRKRNGKFDEAHGIAKIVDSDTKAKLKVSFFGPFYGNYWVLDHADDYSWSIVGESSGRYLWILSREPNPSEQQVRELVNRVSAIGYDTSMLIFDEH